jgi:hypothetical protein
MNANDMTEALLLDRNIRGMQTLVAQVENAMASIRPKGKYQKLNQYKS